MKKVRATARTFACFKGENLYFLIIFRVARTSWLSLESCMK